jgi:hypothetical protein
MAYMGVPMKDENEEVTMKDENEEVYLLAIERVAACVVGNNAVKDDSYPQICYFIISLAQGQRQ